MGLSLSAEQSAAIFILVFVCQQRSGARAVPEQGLAEGTRSITFTRCKISSDIIIFRKSRDFSLQFLPRIFGLF